MRQPSKQRGNVPVSFVRTTESVHTLLRDEGMVLQVRGSFSSGTLEVYIMGLKVSTAVLCCLALPLIFLATDNNSAVAEPKAPAAAGKLVPLFNSDTKLEPVTEDTPNWTTRVADRGRDRHAREGMFKVYEHSSAFTLSFAPPRSRSWTPWPKAATTSPST